MIEIPLALAIIAVRIFFILTLYKLCRAIPEKYLKFPAWFNWLMIIPLVGIIFEWIMLPFGIPMSLKAYQPDNAIIIKKSNLLFGLGLATAILAIFVWLPIIGLIAYLVLFIIYWVKAVEIRKLLIDIAELSHHASN